MTEEAAREFEQVRDQMLIEGASTADLEGIFAKNPKAMKGMVAAELERRKKIKALQSQPGTVENPEIIIVNDFDGYFERLVRRWLERQKEMGLRARHRTIKIDAGPWRSDAIACQSDGEAVIVLDFYSGHRLGFGRYYEEHAQKIIEKWL